MRLAAWFLEIGIHPRKSLTLGPLCVPSDLTRHTIRGLLDGDGSVARYTDGRGRHCFSLRFYSASHAHLTWLANVISDDFGVVGSFGVIRQKNVKNPMFHLTYARAASRIIAAALYSDSSAPSLMRKAIRWHAEAQLMAA